MLLYPVNLPAKFPQIYPSDLSFGSFFLVSVPQADFKHSTSQLVSPERKCPGNATSPQRRWLAERMREMSVCIQREVSMLVFKFLIC